MVRLAVVRLEIKRQIAKRRRKLRLGRERQHIQRANATQPGED